MVLLPLTALRIDDPLYISEQICETMVRNFLLPHLWKNPNFTGFDFLGSDDDTLRLNSMILRVYAKPHSTTNYILLMELDVALCCLQFIGKDVVSLKLTLIWDWTVSSSFPDEFGRDTTHWWILYNLQRCSGSWPSVAPSLWERIQSTIPLIFADKVTFNVFLFDAS